MNIVRKLRTFLFILRRNPNHAWDLLQLRTEAALGLSLHGVSLRRLVTRRFELRRTRPVSGELRAYGNYFLDPSRIRPRPAVFSVGVGEDLDFDRALLERHEVRLFLFDPTPRSARYVAAAGLPSNATFRSLAVADHDGAIDLYIDDLEGSFESTTSVSVVNKGFKGGSVAIPCRRVGTLMAELGVDTLDVLKLDIEGAAIAVLNDVLDTGIRPAQIAAEFERPDKFRNVLIYLKQLDALFDRLEVAGYEFYRTRPNHAGFQVEILAVRRDAVTDAASAGPAGAAVPA